MMASPTLGLMPRLQRPGFSLDELDAGLGEVLATTAGEALTEGPTGQVAGIMEIARAESQFTPPDFEKAIGDLQAGGDLADVADQLRGSVPVVPRAEAEARVKDAGLSHILKVPGDVREPALAIMIDRARERAEREATLARGPSGFVPGALSVGTSFLAGALDPINLGSAFIPVVGELRYAKLLESAGTAALSRAGVRAGVGAAEGAVGMAMLQPLEWYARTQEGQDFTMADALRNVAFGAGLGATLRSGGGVIADVFRGRAGRPLYPFAEGEPAGPRAAEAPSAAAAADQAAPDMPATDTPATGRTIEEAHDTVYNDVADQLRAAGVPEDQIPANAAVMAANFTALAEQTGRQFGDALDLYREAGLGVRGAGAEALADGGRAFDQFAGPQARTADIGRMKWAELMDTVGKSQKEIYDETGWYKDVDGKWKFYLTDENTKLKPGGEQASGLMLDEVIDAPDLFDAYPQLRDITVVRGGLDAETGGRWKATERELQINGTADARRTLSTIVHELQHAIQDIEKFGRGGNKTVATGVAAQAEKREFERLSREIQALMESDTQVAETYRARNRAVIAKDFDALDALDETLYASEAGRRIMALDWERSKLESKRPADALDAYERLPGEVEARNAERWAAQAQKGMPGRQIVARRDALLALDEAQRRGAPADEIARLMDDVRRATDEEREMGTIGGVDFVGTTELRERLEAAHAAGASQDELRAMVAEANKSRLSRKMYPWETRDVAEGDIIRSFDQSAPAAKAPIYYSAVERTVAAAKQAKATPDQWLATLKNTPGVKPEELEWLGLEGWLKEQTGTITKDQVLDYVRANQIEVREVTKGELVTELPPGYKAVQIGDEWAVREARGTYIARGSRTEAEALETALKVLQETGEVTDQTKFGNYTLPGGENYREVLLTLPNKKQYSLPDGWSAEQTDRGWRVVNRYGDVISRGSTEGDAIALAIRDRGDRSFDEYRSSHWDEPNILAHVRFDDRVSDGKKTLHLAEIQSDWHQAGRKRGYGNNYEVVRDGRDVVQSFKTEAEADDYAKANWSPENNVAVRPASGVPDAPFKTTWPELALKRMIRYAAENGYERLTWDTGATSADRYDLSKQIERVIYYPDTKELRAFRPGERRADVIREGVEPTDLPDIIGKEAAERLINEPTEKTTDATGATIHVLSGLDLRTGGEGMVGFYDKILPAAAQKLVKKYGARVERATLEVAESIDQTNVDVPFLVRDRAGNVIESTQSETRAAQLAREIEGTYDFDPDVGRRVEGFSTPVHSIDITPDLRRVAVEQGFPMFQGAPENPRGRITFSQGRAIIDLFAKADASTFMHEAAHFFLEQRIRLVDQLPADAPLRRDLATITDWLGVARPEDIGTEQHERFARGFEAYLAEGKAPSEKLAGAFERFKQWLIAIYRSIANLDSPITDDVRAVFDRMLATEGELARRPSPAMEAIADLPPRARQDAMRVAIAALVDGEPVRVGEMLTEAAKTDPRIAESVALMGGENVRGTEPAGPGGAAGAEQGPGAAAADRGTEPGAVPAAGSPGGIAEPASVGDGDAVAVRQRPTKGPAARPEETWTLLEFLASRGGIAASDPLVADVRMSIGRDNKFVPGFGPLIRKGGMTLDRAREAAVEAGYIIDHGAEKGRESTTTVRTILDAMDSELRGNRVYRDGYTPEPTKRDLDRVADESRHQREAAIDEALADIGDGPKSMSKDRRARVIEIMEREGVTDPHEAMEREAIEWVQNATDRGTAKRIADDVQGWDAPDAGPATAASRAAAPVEGTGGGGAGAPPGEAGGPAGASGAAVGRDVIDQTAAGAQIVMPGAEQSARQLAAAREAQGRGRMTAARTQADPGGLFAPRPVDEPDMFAAINAAKAAPAPPADRKARLQAALAAEQDSDAMFKALESTLEPAQVERVQAAIADAKLAGDDAQEVLRRGVGCLLNGGAGL